MYLLSPSNTFYGVPCTNLLSTCVFPGSTGCWSRVDPVTGNLEPLGASQEWKVEQVVYQEAGEYRCIAPSKDYFQKFDALRNVLTVNVVVSGKSVSIFLICGNFFDG